MSDHELKTCREPFQAVFDGEKSFEIRVNDRGFKTGDAVILREWGEEGGYSGRIIKAKIGYLIQGQYGLPSGLCVFELKAIYRKDKYRVKL